MNKFTNLSGYFTALVIAMVAVNTVRAQPTIPPLPELQFAEIQAKEKFTGDRWSYMEAGLKDAPVIVTLHGLGDNAMQWRFQLAGLSDRFRVIAWNAPGYMLTDGFKTETPGCREYADALADFLDALKLTRVHLLGNSFGSRVAQCFAMHYPARVNKMVFVGASAGRKGMTEQEKAQLMASRKEQIGQGGYNFPDKIVKALLNSKATPELIELTSYALRAVDPRGFMVAVAATSTDGARNDAAWGRNPKGTITYTREGWMSAVLNYGGRQPLSNADRFQARPEEKAAAYETSFSYAGRYEVKSDQVIHHVEVASVENWVKTDLIRNFRLAGDRLILLTPPLSTQGKANNYELVWERVK